jgi:signal peptidase I
MKMSTPPDKSVIHATLDLWRAQGKQHSISITGDSMLPLLHDGDRVLVTHDCAKIEPGDVIVFWQAERLFVHRITQRTQINGQIYWRTKGDNAPDVDPPITAAQIIGKVIAIQRGANEIDVTTRAWRWRGRFIAALTRGMQNMIALGENIKRRTLGAQPNRQTTWVRQKFSAFGARLEKIMLTWFFGRRASR